ncbi:hypothetical protein SAMN06269185_0023 [Natronoarchaeum philippinense]|uniref:Uncharacterized protein n=1 Tax=Natronoarchaeum philippinense TaxID=558529 RepID=A0A285N0J3_NATPI|nr:hypothetical protein [Natronoarchaeum philippinense]SNZ02443.1 hypothetical protein SAMN06269185_0023 [Natronoarchaeum philippinense]
MSVKNNVQPADAISAADIPSTPYRILEWVLYAIAAQFILLGIVMSVGSVGILATGSSSEGAASAGILALGGMFLFILAVGFLLTVVSALALYLDAETVRDSAADWSPTPWLYALAGLLLPGLAVLHYLYVRQANIVDIEQRENWWVVMVVTAVGLLVVTALLRAVPFTFGSTFSLAGLFMIGLYKDAKYTASHGDGWTPSPPTQFTVAVMTSFLATVVYPLYTIYYLVRRHRSVGLF